MFLSWLIIVSTDDLFLSSGYVLLDFYLPYFGKRHTLSYALVNISREADAARQGMWDAMHATRARGGRIFAYNLEAEEYGDLRDVLDAYAAQLTRVVLPNAPAGFILYKVAGGNY